MMNENSLTGCTSLIAVGLFFKWKVGRLLGEYDSNLNPLFTVSPLEKKVSFCFDNIVQVASRPSKIYLTVHPPLVLLLHFGSCYTRCLWPSVAVCLTHEF